MIWFLIIARTLVIFGVALWRAWALWRRPSKSSEWMVVWAIVLLGISALLEIASKVDVINGGLHTYLFAWLQAMFLMLAILSTALYFIYHWGNPKARHAYAAVAVTTFLASVLGGLYFTWVVPAGAEVFEFDSPASSDSISPPRSSFQSGSSLFRCSRSAQPRYPKGRYRGA